MSAAVTVTTANSAPVSLSPSAFHPDGRWVCLLLGLQALLLAWGAARSSPTHLEPALLASGLSHWEFGRLDLYHVNPPLVRMIAAAPVIALGYEANWSGFSDRPGARPEYLIGEQFIRANGERSLWLVTVARWICLPFTLMGGLFAYRWARELYGRRAGLTTLTLWCLDPLVIAQGTLITPDAACTAGGIASGYFFWRWLKAPTWAGALWAGTVLGVTQLTKLSWLILAGLYPLVWVTWIIAAASDRRYVRDVSSSTVTDATDQRIPDHGVSFPIQAGMLASLLAMALLVLNLGYGFDGAGTRLSQLTFVSRSLTGLEVPGTPGNRFQGTLLGELPIPVPRHYLLGFDTQKRDFEEYSRPSYLRGVWRPEGWWYYYLYGLLVKAPAGTVVLVMVVVVRRLVSTIRRWKSSATRVEVRAVRHRSLVLGELVLMVPAIALVALASSQTSFNHHLRYVFPAYGLLLIFAGQAAVLGPAQPAVQRWVAAGLVACSGVSSLWAYPHHISYFNEFVGGPRHGNQHLLGSSWDWGQDWLYLADWFEQHPDYRFEGDLRKLMTTYPVESILPQFHHQSARSLRTVDSQWIAEVDNRVTSPMTARTADEIHHVGLYKVSIVRVRTIRDKPALPR